MSRIPRRVLDRVRDMLEAISNAKSDIGDLGKEQFLADGKTQRAVIESMIPPHLLNPPSYRVPHVDFNDHERHVTPSPERISASALIAPLNTIGAAHSDLPLAETSTLQQLRCT